MPASSGIIGDVIMTEAGGFKGKVRIAAISIMTLACAGILVLVLLAISYR